jgi:uncharacterized protein YxeA
MHDDDRKDSSTNTVLIVLGVVVGVLLLVILACGGLTFLFIRTASNAMAPMIQAAQDMQQAESTAQMFLNTLQAGQVDAAYKSTTDAFQAKQTQKQFQTFVDQNPLLTKYQTANMAVLNQNGESLSVQYTLSGNGVMNVTFHLVKDANGTWKVDAMTIP